MMITSDASLMGWGATCNGVRTRGPWSPTKQSLYINCLELLAATCNPDICKEEIRDFNTFASGQLHSCCLHQQKGGDCVTHVVTTNKGPLTAVVHEEEHPSSSSAPSRCPEHSCRRGDQNMVRQIGVAVSNYISENQCPARSSVHRPICKQAIITAPSVRELETRPSGSGHRCLHTGLDLEIVCNDRQSPVTHTLTRSSGASLHSTSLESSSMVSIAPSNVGQSTNSHSMHSHQTHSNQCVRTTCQISSHS